MILAVVGRASSDKNRSMSLAIATAAGSTGQVFDAPLAECFLTFMTWQQAFMIFAALILSILMVLPMMRSPVTVTKAELEETLGATIKRDFIDPSFTLIFLVSLHVAISWHLSHHTSPLFNRNMWPCRTRINAHRAGHQHNQHTWGQCNITHRIDEYRGYITGRILRPTVLQKVFACRNSYGPNHHNNVIYLDSNDTHNGNPILDWHGQLEVGNSAAHV